MRDVLSRCARNRPKRSHQMAELALVEVRELQWPSSHAECCHTGLGSLLIASQCPPSWQSVVGDSAHLVCGERCPRAGKGLHTD